MKKLKFGYWKDWWFNKPEQERKRLKSFIPLVLYTIGFIYFVIYLSILNSVNRYNMGSTVKSWFGGDTPMLRQLKEEQEREIEESFQGLRKPVSGGR